MNTTDTTDTTDTTNDTTATAGTYRVVHANNLYTVQLDADASAAVFDIHGNWLAVFDRSGKRDAFIGHLGASVGKEMLLSLVAKAEEKAAQ